MFRSNLPASTTPRSFALVLSAVFLLSTLAFAPLTGAQDALPGTYGLKIYSVNSITYPFVQVYFRSFDQNMLPLVNLNERNIGLMVKGRSYDPMKRQYFVQSLRQRQEAARTVIILDASKSMQGLPFEAALRASARFIDSKRPQDEVAILAIRDTKEGFETVSSFERDPGALARRMADVRCDGKRTRLFDTIAAGLQACGAASQGSVSPGSSSIIVSNSIVVFSDGRDEGSAVSREELNTRISSLPIPLPIYSLAYSKVSQKWFKNLESLSKNSFGKYYLIAESFDKMQRTVEEIQNIIQSDYVLTFRAYVPIDGAEHAFKVGVEYPAGSGKYKYESAKFEALEPPPDPRLLQKIDELRFNLPDTPSGSPFLERVATQPQ
ncbi:MAG: VWA domain-containing protein [Desulfobacteraceae bacterium]|nr:VWA domain-containing protein [Desulfobacteraceae bacterium]